MYLIVGLGNPGKRYKLSRHNIGFMVVQNLATKIGVELKQKSFDALWDKGQIKGKKSYFSSASNIHEFEWYCGEAVTVVL